MSKAYPPPEPSLDGPRLKLKRANQHLGLLKRHLQRLRKEHPHRIREQPHAETGQYVKDIVAPATPPIWSLIIGDVAHNLRSALDHLAWQLAIVSSPTGNPENEWEPRQIDWPIYVDPDRYQGTRPVWRLDGLSETLASAVEDCQPYKRWIPPEADPLWMLHQLSNIDKHRLLHARVVDRRDVPARPFRRVVTHADRHQETIYGPPAPGEAMKVVANLGSGQTEVHVEGHFPFEVELLQRGTILHEQPVLGLLNAMAHEVREVLGLFDPLPVDLD
jgi:hypothetical protein